VTDDANPAAEDQGSDLKISREAHVMQAYIARWYGQRDSGFDRLMNWVVGALLLAAVALLVFVQTHPPV
jgi:hypothetical protein